MTKINIMQLISPLTIAGAERVVLMLARNIDRDRFDLSLCLFLNAEEPVNPFVLEAENLDIRIKRIYLERIFEWKQVKQLIQILREERIDILHTHSHRADITGYLANGFSNSKLVSTVHGFTPTSGKLRIYEALDNIILRRFDRIIAVSEAIRKELINRRIKRDKISVVHNALDFDRYDLNADRETFRKELGVKEGDKLIGAIGRLSKEKGIAYLLAAAKQIVMYEKNIKFVIVGEGPESNRLLRMSTELGINDHVIFTGYRTDINDIYQAIDLFVLPSLSEGVPISLLEAAFFRKPFVATRVGGIPEVFHNIGLLVEPANVDELAAKLIYLIRDQAEAEKVGNEAYERLAKKCSPKDWVSAVEDIYFELIGE